MTVDANIESNDLGCCRVRRRLVPTQSGNSGNCWKKIIVSSLGGCCNSNEIYQDVSTFFILLAADLREEEMRGQQNKFAAFGLNAVWGEQPKLVAEMSS